MAGFSATDAALEGFRVTREKPRAVLAWAGFYLAVSVVASVVMIGMGGDTLMQLEAAGAGGGAGQTVSSLEKLGPVYIVLLLLGLLVQAILGAAVYRAMLRPADRGVGYLKLGGDELRLIGLTVIYLLLAMAAFAVLILVAGLIGAGVGAAAGHRSALAGLVGAGIGLFVAGLMIYVVVRLSLAPVITFAEQRISVFASWGMTHGQFWRLLGAYVLAVISAFVVLLLSMIVFVAVAAVAAGGDLASVGKLFAPDLSSLSAYFTPTMVVYTVFGALLNALYYAILLAPGAFAYRALQSADAVAG